MVGITCRLHSAEDYRAIAELRWLLKRPVGSSEDLDHEGAFAARYLQHLDACDSAGMTHHWLAEVDGEVVAVMTIRRVLKEPSPSGSSPCWGYLTNCIVKRAHRNRGIGTALLSAIKAWAAREAFELLLVWPSARSYLFYRRAGFVGQDDPLMLTISSDAD